MARIVWMAVVALMLTALAVSGLIPEGWQVPFMLLASVGGLVVSVVVMLPDVFQQHRIEHRRQKACCHILGVGLAASIATLLLLYGS